MKEIDKLTDRELLEEILHSQKDIKSQLSGVPNSTYWSFIMLGVILMILLFEFPPLWLR